MLVTCHGSSQAQLDSTQLSSSSERYMHRLRLTKNVIFLAFSREAFRRTIHIYPNIVSKCDILHFKPSEESEHKPEGTLKSEE